MKIFKSEEFLNKYVTVTIMDDSIEGTLISIEDNGILLYDEDGESSYNYYIRLDKIQYIELCEDL